MNIPAPRFLPAGSTSWFRDVDVAIVGTGAAGLSAALAAANRGLRVVLLCKGPLESGSTPHAQGGMAAVSGPRDTFASHVSDTMVAAVGLANEERVRELVLSAPGVVRLLSELGAHFDNGPLGLEGGHSHHRIVHAGGDAIGAELHRVLRRAVIDSGVEILENTVAIDVITDDCGDVAGVIAGRVTSRRAALEVGEISARAVVLATGGYGQVFASSTNPLDVTGDGLALALRAGADVTNVEFVQFHPTVLYVPGRRGQSPLVTEALRGAGATLIDVDGLSVMRGHHPLGDLAPRDVVSFTMLQRMNTGGGPSTHLWLDARALGARRLEEEFPTTLALARSLGVEPTREPIPVTPGAHYACGGVSADLDGTTSVGGLYAVGEVASTGVHGANRLASNSLTEALISGRRLGEGLAESVSTPRRNPQSTNRPANGRGVDPSTREALATQMSLHAGVLRNEAGLMGLLQTLDATAVAPAMPLDLETLEATNLHTVSTLVVGAALLRNESRGCHRRSDFELTSPAWEHATTLRVVDGEIEVQLGAMAGA